MGLNMIAAILVLLANQLADIAYAMVDPRIRYD
jgi:ABC-type dipeptide/oligopeptide/nickel transport system permease component